MSNKAPIYDDFDAYFATFNQEERQELARADAALDLASLLYHARKARNLTQKLAALRSGVRQQAISRWERSHPNVQVETLRSYLAALGYNLALVITDAETGEVMGTTGLPASENNEEGETVPPSGQVSAPVELTEATSSTTAWHDWALSSTLTGAPFYQLGEPEALTNPYLQSLWRFLEHSTRETPEKYECGWDMPSTTLHSNALWRYAQQSAPVLQGHAAGSQSTPGAAYDLLAGQSALRYGAGVVGGSGLTMNGQRTPVDTLRDRQEVA